MTATLELLGYAAGERVLIIHADDAGFCHASNVAVFEGLLQGSLTSASAIVPAPWFTETANLHRENPDTDIGVHMALNAEYEVYRWPPLTGATGLRAPDGGMWRDVASVAQHASADEARAELRAQIERALAAGLGVTHLDTHMGAVLHPKFIGVYVDLAVEYRLPLFMMRPAERAVARMGAAFGEQARRLEALGWPLLDNVITRTLSEIAPEEKERRFRELFAELRPGLTHFLVHPAADSDELRAATPSDAAHRAADHAAFRDGSMRAYCESLGIRLAGYREIRDRLRASVK